MGDARCRMSDVGCRMSVGMFSEQRGGSGAPSAERAQDEGLGDERELVQF